MITITGQILTLTVGSAKEIMRQLVQSGLIDHDDAMFSLEMKDKGNAEIILPFPHNLEMITGPQEPVNDINGH